MMRAVDLFAGLGGWTDVNSRVDQIANALGVTLSPHQRHTLEQIVADIQITTRRQMIQALKKGSRN